MTLSPVSCKNRNLFTLNSHVVSTVKMSNAKSSRNRALLTSWSLAASSSFSFSVDFSSFSWYSAKTAPMNSWIRKQRNSKNAIFLWAEAWLYWLYEQKASTPTHRKLGRAYYCFTRSVIFCPYFAWQVKSSLLQGRKSTQKGGLYFRAKW